MDNENHFYIICYYQHSYDELVSDLRVRVQGEKCERVCDFEVQ